MHISRCVAEAESKFIKLGNHSMLVMFGAYGIGFGNSDFGLREKKTFAVAPERF